VGYAGRVIDDKLINEDNPRYKLPGKRERNGSFYEFRKTLFYTTAFGLKRPLMILLSSRASHQFGAVSESTPECDRNDGIGLFRKAGRTHRALTNRLQVWIIPDGDAAGERFAESLLHQVSSIVSCVG